MQGDPLQFTHIARCRTISGRITRFEIKENIMRHLTMLIRLAIFAESYRYYISNLYVRLLLHLAPHCLYPRFLAKLHATARNVPRVRVRPHTLRRFAHENLAVKLGGSAARTQSRMKASERAFSAVADNGDTHRKECGYGKRKRLKFRYDYLFSAAISYCRSARRSSNAAISGSYERIYPISSTPSLRHAFTKRSISKRYSCPLQPTICCSRSTRISSLGLRPASICIWSTMSLGSSMGSSPFL